MPARRPERARPQARLPERLARAWSWGSDPVRTVLFFALAPVLLFAGSAGAVGWSWWQRLLAGAAALGLTAYLLLVLLGGLRIARGRMQRRRAHRR